MILDIIITKNSRICFKYLLIFILIVLIIFVLLNSYKKKYNKKEGFENSVRTKTDTNGIDFTTGSFIVSSDDLYNEINRLQRESNRIDGVNKKNLNNYINNLKNIQNKFNDIPNSRGEINKGYLTQIKELQEDITKKLKEYFNENNFKIIDGYIGIVSKDIINSSCKTNKGKDIFNKCKRVCQQTCVDNEMCHGYNYTDDPNGNDYCELVINKRKKNFRNNSSNTKFFMKKNSEPLNWNYTVNNRKSANPNVETIETIKQPDSIINCSDKCDAYNDVNNKYCLSFTYGAIPNDDNSNSSEKFIKGCKLYGNVFKRDNSETKNIINNDKTNLYVRNYHDLADTSKLLNVMIKYEPDTPKKIIKEGNIKLKFKDSTLPFKYSTNIRETYLKTNNNQFLFGSDKNKDIINLEILNNTEHDNLNNVYKNVNPLNNITNSDNSILDFNKLLHKNSIIRLKAVSTITKIIIEIYWVTYRMKIRRPFRRTKIRKIKVKKPRIKSLVMGNTNFIKNNQNYLGYTDNLNLNNLSNFDLTKFEIERVEDNNSNKNSELYNKSDFIYSGDTIFIKKNDYYLSRGNDGKYRFIRNKYYAIKFIIEQD
jgi:hypothetical protein